VSSDHNEIMALVRTAFGQRRKMLRRSLSGLVNADQFAVAGVSPEDRPEQLGVAQWDALTAAVLADRDTSPPPAPQWADDH